MILFSAVESTILYDRALFLLENGMIFGILRLFVNIGVRNIYFIVFQAVK